MDTRFKLEFDYYLPHLVAVASAFFFGVEPVTMQCCPVAVEQLSSSCYDKTFKIIAASKCYGNLTEKTGQNDRKSIILPRS